MRFANDEYKDLTDVELRRIYIQMGGNIPNFDRGATLLTPAQKQLLRDEFPDLAGMDDYEIQQHFLQFGRQEMLDGTRKKLPALVPPVSPYTGLDSIADISAARSRNSCTSRWYTFRCTDNSRYQMVQFLQVQMLVQQLVN